KYMRCKSFLGILLLSVPAWAQSYVISTIAGSGAPVTPIAASQASIGDPARVACDAAGSVYFASLHSVFKVDTSGTLTRVAGNGNPGYSGDGGLGTDAQLLNPMGVAFDSAGALYVVDHDAAVVRKVAADGTITTVA